MTFEATICGDLMHNGAGTGGLTEDSNTGRVSTEEMDVLLHPFESEALIQKSDVSSPIVLEVGTRQEPKGTTLN